MTYRNEHNDPNRTKTVLSPEEVKAMLTGSAPSGGQQEREDKALDTLQHETSWEDVDGVRVVTMPHTRAVFMDDYGKPALRCPPCGRAWDCACGTGCIYCVGGVPRRAEGEQEYYG